MNSIVEHWFASCTILATAGFWTILVMMTWQETRCEHNRRKVTYTTGPVVNTVTNPVSETVTPVKPSSMMVCHHVIGQGGVPCMNRLPCPIHGGSL